MRNFKLEESIAAENNIAEQLNEWSGSECRRYQLDRRVTPINVIERFFYRGARTQHRRHTDQNQFNYVDRHEPHLFLISIAIILFSILDAFLTLEILKSGGTELNYFANKLIGLGLYGFIFSKYILTALGMVILVLHKHYQVYYGLQVRHIIYGIVAIYSTLILYELIIVIHYL
ncbi:hypothetical protein MNBD_GAMMA22-1930 [hydrothermal vent metagenome]|uniref:DUF5658 domain-containing protein n=1 Tax=hydrothermal vent metagenome TaxID=652676 RepID=A0A3B1AT27_9ZZZZ